MKHSKTFFIAWAILAVAWPAMAADNGVVRVGPDVDQPANASTTTQPVVADNAATTQPAPLGGAPEGTIGDSDSQAIAQSIAAIQQAATPQGAKAAYDGGLLVDRSNQDLRQAYLHKLSQLGFCREAYVPAQALYNMNPRNTLALGVIAVNEGLDGRMNQALRDISDAVIMGAQEPLVLATAGRLYAWYDVRPLATVIQEGVKDLVAYARTVVGDDETYKAAYYAASQDPTQQPFGHVVLGTKPGIVRVVTAQSTGPLASPPAAGFSDYDVQNALWYGNFQWFGHRYPPGFRASPGPYGGMLQGAFPGSTRVGGGMPQMTPPTFNAGAALNLSDW